MVCALGHTFCLMVCALGRTFCLMVCTVGRTFCLMVCTNLYSNAFAPIILLHAPICDSVVGLLAGDECRGEGGLEGFPDMEEKL